MYKYKYIYIYILYINSSLDLSADENPTTEYELYNVNMNKIEK